MKKDANAARIGQIFSTLYEHMETPPYVEAGCHFLATMSYVLLREAGVEAALCMGWVQRPELGRLMYPHSWVEIEGRPFDIAIARPHPGRRFAAGSPVMNGLDLDTGVATVARYGAFSEKSLGSEAQAILNGTVGSYVSQCPWGSGYFWKNLEILGPKAGLEVSAPSLEAVYANSRWTLRNVPE